jgi:surfactin synthase thioesterase subunit
VQPFTSRQAKSVPLSIWIGGRPRTQTQPRARLLCFAHAGGGSSFFQPWRQAFGDDVEICPIVLPGREIRLGERRYNRLEDLMEPMLDGLMPFLDVPYGVFGHSLGSIIAFEFARKAAARGRKPELLAVSGRRAPHLRARRSPRYQLDDANLLAVVAEFGGTAAAVLEDRELMKLFLPILRDDFAMNETYAPLPGRPLSCDIVAVTGDADKEVREEELVAWREVTTGAFEHHVLAGGHFYMQPDPRALLDIMRAALTRHGISRPFVTC